MASETCGTEGLAKVSAGAVTPKPGDICDIAQVSTRNFDLSEALPIPITMPPRSRSPSQDGGPASKRKRTDNTEPADTSSSATTPDIQEVAPPAEQTLTRKKKTRKNDTESNSTKARFEARWNTKNVSDEEILGKFFIL